MNKITKYTTTMVANMKEEELIKIKTGLIEILRKQDDDLLAKLLYIAEPF